MGIDILLDELTQILRNFEPGKFGPLFIIDDNGLLGTNVSVTAVQLNRELSSPKTGEIVKIIFVAELI